MKIELLTPHASKKSHMTLEYNRQSEFLYFNERPFPLQDLLVIENEDSVEVLHKGHLLFKVLKATIEAHPRGKEFFTLLIEAIAFVRANRGFFRRVVNAFKNLFKR